MRKVQYTIEELTCPECGFVAVNANGLRGHRQFKHGVRPSGAQLPLKTQDLLVSESKLEQLLDERFGVISKQVDALSGELEQLAEVAKGDGAAITKLKERLNAAERKTIDDFSEMEKARFVIPWMQGLDAEEFVRLALVTGHDAQLVEVNDPAVVSVLAESFRRQEEEKQAEEEKAKVLRGRTDLPGYRYLEYVNLSVYVGEEELAKERQELVDLINKRLSEGMERLGDQVVNTVKIATELVENLAEIQRRREQAKRKG